MDPVVMAKKSYRRWLAIEDLQGAMNQAIFDEIVVSKHGIVGDRKLYVQTASLQTDSTRRLF
jgi:hypothetical protein